MSQFRPSLRLALTVPLLVLFAATLALQAYTQHEQIGLLSERSSVRLLEAIASSTHTHLRDFLEEPFRLQRDLGDDLVRHRINPEDELRTMYSLFLHVFKTLYADQHQIEAVGLGNPNGDFAGVRRAPDGSFKLMLKDRNSGGALRTFAGESPATPELTLPAFDPRQRPWYQTAAELDRPGWAPLYTNQKDERAEVILSAVSPVKRDGKLSGVMFADVSLHGINRFLREEQLRGEGLLLIVDADGRIVAQSETTPMFTPLSPNRQRERLTVAQSASPLIRAVAPRLQGPDGEREQRFTLRHDGQLYFGHSQPYADPRGIDWHIVALLPESELLGAARAASERALYWGLLIDGLGILCILWIIHRLTAQIRQTAQAATRLSLGDWDSTAHRASRLAETTQLVDAFNAMSQRLQHSFARLQQQILYDELTGLCTRRGLLEKVNWPQTRPSVLVLIGLDRFRSINDTVGFSTGDVLLQTIALRLQHHIDRDALLARVGGDEFAVLAPLPAEAETAPIAFGERLQALFEAPFACGADALTLSVSLGVVAGRLAASELPEWLRRASIALGAAKRRPGSPPVVFSAAMLDSSLEHARLVTALRRALQLNEFVVHYQPIVDLANQRPIGVEALVRWQSPERGLVPPGVFIPVAEESDLILEIDERVLRLACSEVARQLEALPDDFDLHVNLSPRQLIQANFFSTLEEILRTSGLPPERLTLELTESQLVEEDQAISERLRRIRDLGCRIAIDDFGTGYSSLAYLSRLSFDCLKIDKHFVQKMQTSPQDASIITGVLHMARGFGVNVVAEGVETAAEAACLKVMGCPQGQGYYFGRPAPLEALTSAARPAPVPPG